MEQEQEKKRGRETEEKTEKKEDNWDQIISYLPQRRCQMYLLSVFHNLGRFQRAERRSAAKWMNTWANVDAFQKHNVEW